MVEYFEKFYLPLAGGISVCKTFMLSQIGYTGSFITPDWNQTKRMQDLMDNFCLGTIRFARKKFYLPANMGGGGLGLINIKHFITALQCSWIKRTSQHCCDNWRFDVKAASYGNPLTVTMGTIDHIEHPVLSNINTNRTISTSYMHC
jgi:hypothetical protein